MMKLQDVPALALDRNVISFTPRAHGTHRIGNYLGLRAVLDVVPSRKPYSCFSNRYLIRL